MTQTLPSWLPAVIAGGLYAAAGWVVVGVASAAVDWADRRKTRRAPDADRTAAPRRALDAPLSDETGSQVPAELEPAERRSEPQPRNTEPKEHPMTATHTRTHVYVSFANPFLVCDLCRQPATRWHDHHKCGCDTRSWIDPCGHNAEAVSVCPSWSPLDGCLCQEVLGRVDHAPAPTPA